MRVFYIFLLFIFSTIAIGCGPKCPSLPETRASIIYSNNIPFRICTIAVGFADPSEQIEDKNYFDYKSFDDVEKVIFENLYDSGITNTTTATAVTVDVLIKALGIGTDTLWSQTPSFFSAKYIVKDMASGNILLEKTYEKEQSFKREADFRCGLVANAYAALTTAVNTVTNEFIKDLGKISPTNSQIATESQINGSLQLVYTEIPSTQKNLHWYFTLAKTHKPFTIHYRTQLKSQITYGLIHRISDEKLFNGAVTPSYSIKIYVPAIAAIPDTLFGPKKSSAFYADAVIYKNGKEIESIEFSPAEYDHHAELHKIIPIFIDNIVKRLRTIDQQG